MLYQLKIMRGTQILVHVSVDAALDATGTEVGNHLRWALLDALPEEEAHEDHDQFLIATAACDWAGKALRGRRPCIATLPLSQGRPCTTVPYPPEHVRLDPEEAYVVLEATEDDDVNLLTARTVHLALAG